MYHHYTKSLPYLISSVVHCIKKVKTIVKTNWLESKITKNNSIKCSWSTSESSNAGFHTFTAYYFPHWLEPNPLILWNVDNDIIQTITITHDYIYRLGKHQSLHQHVKHFDITTVQTP